jgi:hypothetical protein
MSSETLASTILTASITGAGLIIAIYALITPITRKIFEEKVALMRKKKKQFDKLKIEIDSESSTKDFKQLKTLASEIKGVKMFPNYLGIGVFVVFSFYILTVALAFNWLIGDPATNPTGGITTLISFAFSTIGFLVVGMLAIRDVHSAMKKEFEQLKKEKEEVEDVSKRFERYLEAYKEG